MAMSRKEIAVLLLATLVFSVVMGGRTRDTVYGQEPGADASAVLEKRCEKAVIDYSDTGNGYVTVQYTASTGQRLKALADGSTTQYQYDSTPGGKTVLPLSDGNETYKVGVYENVKGTSYACIVSQSMSVTLNNEFAPFLRSNQYVEFEAAPQTVAKAAELCAGIADPLKKVEAVYRYVIGSMTYDKRKAATVKNGYLPVLDDVLAKKSGICFDYAALMAGMLRSQSAPCKLAVGYAGSALLTLTTCSYHTTDGRFVVVARRKEEP